MRRQTRMVRVDLELYERLQEYEKELMVPVSAAVNEAVRDFIATSVKERLRFVRQKRKYQNDTLAG